MRNQPPTPLTGRRARAAAPAPAEQPAQVAGQELAHVVAAHAKPAAPSSPPTSPARTPSTSPAGAETPEMKRMPVMGIFFFHPHCYEMFERAAELQGVSLHDWVQDSLYDVAEAAIQFDERDYDKHDEQTEQTEQTERK